MDESKLRQQHELLSELLAGANLQCYLDVLIHNLKVHSTAQLKYVRDDDLLEVGMTKPEVQRLMKLYRKQATQPGKLTKLKKKLLKAGDDDGNVSRRSPSKPGRRSASMHEAGRPRRSGLHAGLISAPQNDLRHTLHVGYDGAMFGDVSLIGRDHLPPQTDTTAPSSDCEDISVSSLSLSLSVRERRRHTTLDTVSSDVSSTNDTSSYIGSIVSSDTLTDVSSLHDLDDDISDDATQVFTSDGCRTPDDSTENHLSDVTIPSFTNFDLGPSLVDEVMKAFGSSGKAGRLEKSPVTNRNVEENSAATTLCQSEGHKILVNPAVVHSVNNVDDSDHETFVSAERTDCVQPPEVQTSFHKNNETNCPQIGGESLLSNEVPQISSESSLRGPTDMKCNKSEGTSVEIWHQQKMPVKKLEQSPRSIQRNNGGNAALLTAGGRYPAVVGNCSLSPRPVYPRESASRGLSATKGSQSSSSEERIPTGVSSRVAASLVAASSSSLPARSSLCHDSWSKLPHLPSTKVPSAESSDSESGNLLQRLKGKASLSRLSGLRLSIDSRTARSGLPTQNWNVNVHFFNRLREQELQGSDRIDDDNAKLTERVESDNQTPFSQSVGTSKYLPSVWHDSAGSRPISESVISERREVGNNGVEVVSDRTDDMTVVSPILSSHSEVARLSCRSTESHDSFSHDSEHSSTTTQPSDEGVYSDDSVAASADELRPRSEQRTPSSRSAAATTTAIALGISNKQDVFWTCPVNFRDFVNFEESRSRDLQAAERYSAQTDMCYEDRMEYELNGCVDINSASGRQVTEDLQLMSTVVSDVSCEERLYALSETSWDVDNAIKLLLLRQLMSGSSKDVELCKEALMSAGWDVRLASWNLGPRPHEPDSPEIVHV